MAELLFIYNAESGFASALPDTGRRIFRPKSYPCALCIVTYGPFGMKKDWKAFTKSLPYKASFLHNNEMPEYIQKQGFDLPCLLLHESDNLSLLISAEEFRAINNLSSLEQKVRSVLKI